MKHIGISRKILICGFFINITALFLTFFSMAQFPCNGGNNACVTEMNPIPNLIIGFGGFPASIIFAMFFWIVTFFFFERIIVGHYGNKIPKLPLIWTILLVSMLILDLVNNLHIISTMYDIY